MKDLFGNDVEEMYVKKPISKYQKFKMYNNYKLSKDKEKRCKTCKYCSLSQYHNKRYYKCVLLGLSHGNATDIKVNNVCDLYKEEVMK